MTSSTESDWEDRLERYRVSAAGAGLVVVPHELLAHHTTFRIGGACDLFARAPDRESLIRCRELGLAHGLPTMVLGGGSNMLVSDAGVRGVVIAYSAHEIRVHQENSDRSLARASVSVAAGAPLAGLARWCIRSGWSGLEWAVSVPGSVGGAVVGNAGAYGGEIRHHLAWVDVWSEAHGVERWPADRLEFSYRSSILKRLAAAGAGAPAVLAAGFVLTPGDRDEMKSRAQAWLLKRRASQPTEPSAGSIFRNPPDDYAGKLVEAVELKGHRIGDAQISPRHANFIVNLGSATAEDVIGLVDLMRSRVHSSFGVELIPEIVFAGRWKTLPPYARLCEVDKL